MINTYNETSLHKTLKTIYALQQEGSRTEQRLETGDKGYIFDIVTATGAVIEIQTGSLGHLLPKLTYLIAQKRSVTVVFPLATTKYIQTKNDANGTSKRRKSPAKTGIYSYRFFRELTALCPVLLSRYVTLEVLEVTMTEERTAGDDLVQSANGRRRFRKNWNKTGKQLNSIDKKWVFHGKKSWLSLLPSSVLRTNAPVTVNSLYEAFIQQGVKLRRNDVQLFVWLFAHLELLTADGKEGRSILYKINK